MTCKIYEGYFINAKKIKCIKLEKGEACLIKTWNQYFIVYCYEGLGNRDFTIPIQPREKDVIEHEFTENDKNRIYQLYNEALALKQSDVRKIEGKHKTRQPPTKPQFLKKPIKITREVKEEVKRDVDKVDVLEDFRKFVEKWLNFIINLTRGG